jgi:hypothetical protein
MQTKSFQKPFELVDQTAGLLLVPNTWGLINELGIFRTQGVTQHSITVESKAGTLGLVTDKARGERNNVNKGVVRQLRSFAVPHFPLDDGISPQDLQGQRMYDSEQAETADAVVAERLERMRMSHAQTLEKARAHALTTGNIYAPNGTVAGNYYTDFGVTRKEIDFVLGTAGTNVIEKSEEGIAHIQDNILSGESISNIIVLCSPEFFKKLVTQAGVQDAYRQYASVQEPLRQRLGSGVYRRFVHGNVEYIEYRGVAPDGTRFIPAGEAYMLPTGTRDTFVTYFSPANKFTHVNTIGEEAYAFTYFDPKDSEIQLQTESNHLSLIRRPQAVVKLITSN